MIPIIMLTASKTTDKITQLDAGADDYIPKSEDLAELLAKVRVFLRIKHLQDQLREQNEKLRYENEMNEMELSMAREVQLGLLPREGGRRGRLHVAFRYLPMRFVGGDLFDVLVGPEGQTAFFVSDVSGHGVSAALITAMVKTSILGQAQHLGSIADLVNRVNQVVCGLAGADRFVTAFFGLLDAQGGQLHYINAGHPPALLARRGERAVEHLQPTEVPLGFLDDVEYSPAATSVAPGDRIVLYTDGITEAPGAAEEQYGVGRLEQSLMAHAGLPLDELVEKTIQDLIQFHGRDTFDDDVNLLVCEVAEA
jgi:sigma-B regulation protein RsbU (phosphoserine phosphatase)